MASELITICPVCNQDKFTSYITSKDYTITGEEFALQQCSHCQFILTNPRPASESIGRYYESDNYISHSGKSKTLFDKIYLTARNITLGWKHELIARYYSTPKRILDFGCGTGNFLNHMKQKGWDIRGVEPNTTAREKSNQLLSNQVFKELESLDDQCFEVITLWHVLEHIHDLNYTIQKLKNRLSTNGYLIIAVPNPNSHDSQYYRSYWAGYDVPRHLWHFTQETMRTLLLKNGLEIVQIEPMKLDAFYVSLLSEGYHNPNQNKMVSASKAFVQGLKSNWLAKKKNEYSSLIYIAKAA